MSKVKINTKDQSLSEEVRYYLNEQGMYSDDPGMEYYNTHKQLFDFTKNRMKKSIFIDGIEELEVNELIVISDQGKRKTVKILAIDNHEKEITLVDEADIPWQISFDDAEIRLQRRSILT